MTERNCSLTLCARRRDCTQLSVDGKHIAHPAISSALSTKVRRGRVRSTEASNVAFRLHERRERQHEISSMTLQHCRSSIRRGAHGSQIGARCTVHTGHIGAQILSQRKVSADAAAACRGVVLRSFAGSVDGTARHVVHSVTHVVDDALGAREDEVTATRILRGLNAVYLRSDCDC